MHPEKDQKTKSDGTAKDEQASTKGFLLFISLTFSSITSF